MAPLSLFFFLLGAIIASFVGLVVARLHTGQSYVAGRSRCDACDTALPPAALIPIISFFVSNGRARCCGARLSCVAPAAELLLAGLFTFAYLTLGLTPALWFTLLSFSTLLALVLYDGMHQILPPFLLWVFVASSALAGFFSADSISSFYNTGMMALVIAASLALIHVLSRGRAMGLADAPLAFGLSLMVGSSRALPGLVFSFWIGALIGIVLLLRRPVGSRMGVEVPFAPFLAAGFLLAYLTQWNPFILAAVWP